MDKQIVSSDAYVIGEITDVRYDPFEWKVAGLKVKTKRSEKLAAGHGKANVLILPERFVLNDVMLLGQPIDRVKDSVVPDNSNISSLSSLISAKVVTRDNALVGTVTAAMIDTDNWKVASIIVRLDKTAIEAMKMKKGLFAKINAEIRTDLILSSKDMVHLNEQMNGVRENMTVLD
ncbi:MAG: PRC-barrel domain-containing protein [Methanomassiliicoccaceae archaeon]|jgi:sporulation protein YlmC with PRC-barrel domain|nr:PRC-barrel domain-containing protein [Methanomassiliicoccaceae archaeon]